MNESMERGFVALPALVAIDAGLVVCAMVFSSSLACIATLFATALTLGRYFAIAAYSRGIDRRSWFFPLTMWLAFYGLLALLLFLAGRKGVIFWPALVALSGPSVFMVASVIRAAGSLAAGGPLRAPPASASLAPESGGEA